MKHGLHFSVIHIEDKLVASALVHRETNVHLEHF